MITDNVCLESIAYEGSWDVSLQDWRQLMDLARRTEAEGFSEVGS